VFVDGSYDDRPPENPDMVVRSLAEAADYILSRFFETAR